MVDPHFCQRNSGFWAIPKSPSLGHNPRLGLLGNNGVSWFILLQLGTIQGIMVLISWDVSWQDDIEWYWPYSLDGLTLDMTKLCSTGTQFLSHSNIIELGLPPQTPQSKRLFRVNAAVCFRDNLQTKLVVWYCMYGYGSMPINPIFRGININIRLYISQWLWCSQTIPWFWPIAIFLSAPDEMWIPWGYFNILVASSWLFFSPTA